MPNWSISFTEEAKKELEDLNSSVRDRVVDKIQWLEDNSHSIFHKELTRDLKNCYKLRVGDWRVIYTINEKFSTIVITMIKHRSKVYKK